MDVNPWSVEEASCSRIRETAPGPQEEGDRRRIVPWVPLAGLIAIRGADPRVG